MPSKKLTNSHEYTKFVFQINDKLSILFNRRKKEKLNILNPFVYKWSIPWYHWIKMGVMTVTIMPLRTVGLVVFFLISYALGCIATVNQPDNKPITGWRKKIVLPLFIFAARTTFFFGGLHWIHSIGKRMNRESIPILVLAPHSAFLDALIVIHLGMSSVVGKMETARSAVGCFLKMTQPVLVNRDDPDSRQNTINEIHRRCNLEEDWPQMLIFPEGTCTNRTCIINFKTGAFMYGLPVQPVVLRWPNRVDTVTWTWEGPGILTLLWMSLTQFHTYVEIEYLPAYYPSNEERQNPKLYASNVRCLMAKQLNIPTIDYSYEDCRHMTLAKQNGLPFSEIVVEFSKITKHLINFYGSEENMMKQLLIILQNVESKRVTVNEFCSKFNIVGDQIRQVEALYKFYDKAKIGAINLRDFVSHLALYSMPYNRKKAFSNAFQAFKASSTFDDCNAYNETLRHVFVLSHDEVNEIFTLVQAQHDNSNINIDTLEEVMLLINGPFNIYKDYFDQYNICKKSRVQNPECIRPENV